jgi:hypothetical protein
MARDLNVGHGAGWAVALGVLIGRSAAPRRWERPVARPAPPRPEPRRRPEAPRRAPGLLLGDAELRILAERDEAWW